ncbi:hypothetical protein ACXYMT_01520 [Salinimicrobium sp. CAU 1759]
MTYQTPQEVLDRLQIITEIVETEVRFAIDKKIDNLRLNYALRKKDPESKDKFTTEKLEKVKEQIGEYDGNLAGFLREAILHEDTFHDDNETLKTLCYNYISEIFWSEELVELDENILENEEYVWQTRLGGKRKQIKKIKRFIEAMALASLYHNLLLFEGIGMARPLEEGMELKPLPANKSSLFNGKKMNLSERIMLANEFLNFTEIINELNIQDSEKYQLMAYILGNDKDNIRNRINGTRTDKVRKQQITAYISSLKK